MKYEGFIHEGEALFLSTKTNLSLCIDNGAPKDGRPLQGIPQYVDFLPGPCGGQFRTKDSKVIAAIKAHNAFQIGQCREIKTYDELTEFVNANEFKRGAADERVIQKGLPKVVRKDPEAPAAVKSPVPVAAVGPKLARV